MSREPLRHIIQISNPDASKRAGLIVLDLANEEEALKVARKLALETGRGVIVRDAKFALIETIQAASIRS